MDLSVSGPGVASLLGAARPRAWSVVGALSRRRHALLLCAASAPRKGHGCDEVVRPVLDQLSRLSSSSRLTDVVRDGSVRILAVGSAEIKRASGGNAFEALTIFHGQVASSVGGAQATVLLCWPPRSGGAQAHSFSHAIAVSMTAVVAVHGRGHFECAVAASGTSASTSTTSADTHGGRSHVLQTSHVPTSGQTTNNHVPGVSMAVSLAEVSSSSHASTDSSDTDHKHRHMHRHTINILVRDAVAGQHATAESIVILKSTGNSEDADERPLALHFDGYVHQHHHQHVHHLELTICVGKDPELIQRGYSLQTFTTSCAAAPRIVSEELRVLAALPILSMELVNVSNRELFQHASCLAFAGLGLGQLLTSGRFREAASHAAAKGVSMAERCERVEYDGMVLVASIVDEFVASLDASALSQRGRAVLAGLRYRGLLDSWPEFDTYWRHVAAGAHAKHYCLWFSEEVALNWLSEGLRAAAVFAALGIGVRSVWRARL